MAKKKKSSARNKSAGPRPGRPPKGTSQQHRAASPPNPEHAKGKGGAGSGHSPSGATTTTAPARANGAPAKGAGATAAARPAKGRPGQRRVPSASADAAWTRHTDTDWIAAGAAALAAFVLYVLTAARHPVTGDNPDFLTAAHELGVPHAPGYPIAVVLGHITGWVPGPEAFGLNLAAVLMGALTVFLLTLTGRLLGAHPWVAAAGALVFAVNPLVWEYFLQLEAFPFAMASVAATVYFLVRWKLDPRTLWPLYAAAVCFGLGLVAHQNIALLVPAILYLGWTERRRTARHEWLYTKGIGLVLASWLLPYLFVVWAAGRDPVMNWGRPDSIGRLWPVIRREGYTDVTFGGSGLGSAPERLWWFVSSFGVAGLLIVAGLVWAWRHRGWWARFALGGVATWAVALVLLNGAISTYGYFVLSRFFLQFHVLLAPAIALGLQWLLEAVRERRPALADRAPWLAAGAGLLAAVVLGAVALPHTSLAGDDVAARHGRDVLESVPQNGVLLVAGDGTALPALYEHTVENVRPDVTVVVTPLLAVPWYVDNLKARHPDLVFPGPHFAPGGTTLKAFFDANPKRTFHVLGGTSINGADDTSLAGSYYYAPRGLGSDVVKQEVDLNLLDVARQNAALFDGFEPPTRAEVRPRTVSFEPVILDTYTAAMSNIGDQLLKAGQKPAAAEWYQRALDIDPTNAAATKGLAGTR
ncbi:MAG: DUF2723 domain-containing protein [Micrococcales bacterium]|nr:DUF2723 domain-containing protein [Micrococcales bacterium]